MGNTYRKFGVITIVSVYLLILVGGIVRSTGAGMGCPDWPTCFGQWIPPTDISQLPANYKEIYKVAGRTIADFNVVHTWTEYVNRLVGVLIGFFIFLAVVFARPYWKQDRPVFWLTFASFLLVAFQGWLGAKVVDTFLQPLIITLHMFLALVIVMLLIYSVVRSYRNVVFPKAWSKAKGLNGLLWGCMAVLLVQILLGTQVREAVDHLAESLTGGARDTWVDQLGLTFYIHRSFSILVLVLHALLFRGLWQKSEAGSALRKWGMGMAVLLGIETFSGIGLAYLGIPPVLQPMHLFFGSLSLGVLGVLWMMVNYESLFPQKVKGEGFVKA